MCPSAAAIPHDTAVDHADHVHLIRDGVSGAGPQWADLGAGRGAFTMALAELLGPGGSIVAVDRDTAALRDLERAMAARFGGVALRTVVADFTYPLALGPLDGIVAANSLHFVADRAPVLARLRGWLRPGGRLVVVEYDTDRGNPWVPHPFSYPRWEREAVSAGFTGTRRIGSVPSRFLGSIYSAVSEA